MDPNELRNTLLQAFSEEAPDLLRKAEQALLDLEDAPDQDRQAPAEALKRALHSLKGSASAIGRDDLRDVCHAMEDLVLHMLQEGVQAFQLDLLHAGLQFLHEAAATPGERHAPEVTLALLKSTDSSAIAAQLSARAVAPKAMETVAEVPSTVDVVSAKNSVQKTNTTDAATGLSETIRVAVSKIDNLQSSVGELVAIRLQQDDSLLQLKELQLQMAELTSQWRLLGSDIRECRQFLPSRTAAKFDNKISSFSGHIKQTERQLFHLAHQIGSQTGQLSLLCDAMDNGLRAVRMMPLAPFLESFRAVARDAARSLGKSVVLECDDKGIEIDRLVLEHIREPLLHLVRNSVGHGIEKSERRLAAGKPETGSIRLSAELRGDYVNIAISDDGAGFNRQKILQKANALGMARTLDELTDEHLIDIVCRPGFSTAAGVDTVSGRGIGMDVVSTMISELGGTVGLETFEGGGSCITLRVPTSLATTQGLILQIGNERYGVVLDLVERIVRTRLDSLAMVEGREVLFLDDNPIAITSLALMLNLSALIPQQRQRAYPIVILRAGTQRLALIVDDIPGEIPMIVKPLGPQFENIKAYAGGAILADGSVMPVLEARYLINSISGASSVSTGVQWQSDENNDGDQQAVDASFATQRAILVVDDSITTRTLERNILEAAGYRVLVATDGEEAADILRIEDGISLVVTDLEMPRMNGLELCRYIRSGQHKNLPIIMVTSVGSEAEMKKGIAAGADAYIVKGNFQQDYFLSTVRRFVNV